MAETSGEDKVKERLAATDIPGALEEVRRILRANPSDPYALEELPIVHFLLGNRQEAIKDFEEALRSNPAHRNIRGALANAYEAVGRLEDAEREYDLAVAGHPDDLSLHTARSWVRRKRGDLKGALEDLTVAAKSGTAEAFAGLGGLESEMSLLKEAAEHFAEAVRLSPSYWPYRFSRGVLMTRLRRWREGEEDLTAVLDKIAGAADLGAERQRAFATRGWCRFQQGHSSAREDLFLAVYLDPRDPRALCYRGALRTAAGETDAVKDLNAALELAPGVALAHALRGDYYLGVGGDKAAALSDYRRAVELDASYAETLADSMRKAGA